MLSDQAFRIRVDDVLVRLRRSAVYSFMAELTPHETEAFDQLPQEEALALLDLLVNRYGITLKRATQPLTEADRHRLEVGHRLSYGCCR